MTHSKFWNANGEIKWLILFHFFLYFGTGPILLVLHKKTANAAASRGWPIGLNQIAIEAKHTAAVSLHRKMSYYAINRLEMEFFLYFKPIYTCYSSALICDWPLFIYFSLKKFIQVNITNFSTRKSIHNLSRAGAMVNAHWLLFMHCANMRLFYNIVYMAVRFATAIALS